MRKNRKQKADKKQKTALRTPERATNEIIAALIAGESADVAVAFDKPGEVAVFPQVFNVVQGNPVPINSGTISISCKEPNK